MERYVVVFAASVISFLCLLTLHPHSDLLYRIKSEIISSEELLVDLLPNNLADLVRAEGGVAYLDFSRRESSVEWLITNGKYSFMIVD